MKDYQMASINTPKKEAEPIGHEFSVDLGKFKEFKAYKVGDKVKFECEGVVVGQHMHNIGKSKQHMMDLKLTDIECDEDEDEDDEEEDDSAE